MRAPVQPAKPFLKRFEHEVDPDGKLQAEEHRRRAEHALRAHMLRLRKRALTAKKVDLTIPRKHENT